MPTDKNKMLHNTLCQEKKNKHVGKTDSSIAQRPKKIHCCAHSHAI